MSPPANRMKRSFRVLRTKLDARTECVRNPFILRLILVAKDDKAPAASASSARYPVLDSEPRQIERQIESDNCCSSLNRRVHHFLDKYAAFVKPEFQFILGPVLVLLGDVSAKYGLLVGCLVRRHRRFLPPDTDTCLRLSIRKTDRRRNLSVWSASVVVSVSRTRTYFGSGSCFLFPPFSRGFLVQNAGVTAQKNSVIHGKLSSSERSSAHRCIASASIRRNTAVALSAHLTVSLDSAEHAYRRLLDGEVPSPLRGMPSRVEPSETHHGSDQRYGLAR